MSDLTTSNSITGIATDYFGIMDSKIASGLITSCMDTFANEFSTKKKKHKSGQGYS